jgi:hypothetical protein
MLLCKVQAHTAAAVKGNNIDAICDEMERRLNPQENEASNHHQSDESSKPTKRVASEILDWEKS